MENKQRQEPEIKYDAEYTIGHTKIYVVAPKISEEENQRRRDEANDVASRIVQEMINDGEL